jgi:hypothetical protein
MKSFNSFFASDEMKLAAIVAVLYFSAILLFAYVFTS